MQKACSHVIKDSDRANDRLKEVNKVLDQLRSAIQLLFVQLGCDSGPIESMLGGEGGLTDNNIMIYLGQVEQRTTELLYKLFFTKLKVGDAKLVCGEIKKKKKIVIPSPSGE